MTDKMNIRVLQVLPNMHSGGVEQEALYISSYLSQHEYYNFICSNGGEIVNQLDSAFCNHIKLPVHSKNPFRMLYNAYLLYKIIKENNINIVHARSRAPAWSCLLACKIAGVSFVTTFHAAYSTGHSLKRFYNSVMLRGQNIIAISNYIAKHIETQYHFTSSNMVVINRGVDILKFSKNAVSDDRINNVLEQLKIDRKFLEFKKIILLPARFSKIKGHLYAIKALSYLQSNDYVCIMVGKNDASSHYLESIKHEIIDHKLSDKVILHTSPVVDMPALYSLCDIVISPSLQPEGFGRTIIEGQAMGKIVIATSIGAPSDIIVDGKTGFLCPVSDAATFSEILDNTLKMSKKKASSMISDAINMVKAHYTLDMMCEKTLDIYRKIITK